MLCLRFRCIKSENIAFHCYIETEFSVFFSPKSEPTSKVSVELTKLLVAAIDAQAVMKLQKTTSCITGMKRLEVRH